MINVLFVDDEPNILSGLKRMLRPMHHEWEMYFAEGGVQALNLLGEKNFDVVISDMKMPGMDGSEFLFHVRNNFPQTVRIILSGYSEKDMIIKSIGTAHQYISKPCDSETLKETVSRACALRDLLTSDKIRRLVSQIHMVPSLPTLYQELMQELNQNDPKMQKIGEIVKKDIGMTVKILQIINSAFFGLRRNISDAGEAISFLGLDTVSSLTLSIGVFAQFETKNGTDSIPGKLWEHSMAVAITAKKIAQSVDKETANDSFTAGLLHDIGEVVLAVNLPEQFSKVNEMMSSEQISQREAELAIFETTHSEVGAYLLGLWGLPHSIVEAVAFHDLPSRFPTGTFSALTAIHVSNIFHEKKNENLFAETDRFFDVNHLSELGLMGDLQKWHEDYMNDF